MMRSVEDRIRKWTAVGDETGCHLWTGATTRGGYGNLYANGRMWRVHRLVYTMKTGPIPDGMWVLHRCDVPACVNPEHLFLGSRHDNIADMVDKGRKAKGSRNGASHLSEADALDIRRLYSEGFLDQEDLARLFGVSQATVSRIVNDKIWTTV